MKWLRIAMAVAFGFGLVAPSPAIGQSDSGLSYQENPLICAGSIFGDPPMDIRGSVTTTASGLQYYDFRVGDGAAPGIGQTLVVQYVGLLASNCLQFDSSLDAGRPFAFTFGGGQVIQGWEEGLATMRVGGQRRLIVPPHLGYGAAGVGPIPPDAWLIFDAEIIEVR